MSYPYNEPSLTLGAAIWTSGSYTPFLVCQGIRDNYTPINKNSIVNSLGYEISLVQNYVNSKYIGREILPINSGFISKLFVNASQSLVDDLSNIGSYGLELSLIVGRNNGGGDVFFHTRAGSGIAFYGTNGDTDRILGYGTYFSVGLGNSELYFLGGDGNYASATFNNDIRGRNLYIYESSQFTPPEDSNLSGFLIANSGIFRHNLIISGGYDIDDNPINNYVIINSGKPKDGWTSDYNLTVSKGSNGNGGDAFFSTNGGCGIIITGDNDNYSRILTPSGRLCLGIENGSTQMIQLAKIDDSQSFIKIANCDFGIFDATPTGCESPITGTDSQKIEKIVALLVNFGFASGV